MNKYDLSASLQLSPQNYFNMNQTQSNKLYGNAFKKINFLSQEQISKQYPQLKNMATQSYKKSLIDSIQKILTIQKQKKQKNLIRPSQERNKYSQLYEWLITRFQFLQNSDYHQNMTTIQYLEEYKKVLLSGYLQLKQLVNLQCQEKSNVLKILFNTSFQIMNTLVLKVQNDFQNALFSHLNQKLRTEAQLLQQIQQLKKSNQQLTKQKNHKWKNLYMVIKDNRIVKKQKNKLFKALKQQQWKVKVINEQHMKLKQEHQKQKLLLSQLQNIDSEQDQTKRISNYVNTKVQVDQINKYIKLYPKKVQKIVANELKKIQIHQLSTLNQKMAFILKAIQNAGQMIQDLDDINDFLNINKVKMSFNISTQTQVIMKQMGINTNQKNYTNHQTQVPYFRLSYKFKFQRQNVNQKIRPTQIQLKRNQRKGKTVNIANSQKVTLNKSNRKIGSIKRLIMEDYDLSQGFQYYHAVNLNYPKDFAHKKNKQNYKRKDTVSSDSESQSQYNQNIKTFINYQNFPSRKNRGTIDSQTKQQKSKLFSRNKQKRVSRLENMHTFSSKLKMKQVKTEQQSWKITRIFAFNVNQQIDENHCFLFDNNKKHRKRITVKIPAFNTQNYLTGNLLNRWSPKHNQQNSINQSQEGQEVLVKLATNRNISSVIQNKDVFNVTNFSQKFNPSNIDQVITRQKSQSKKRNSKDQINKQQEKKQKFNKLGKNHLRSQSKDSFRVNNFRKNSKQSINTITTDQYVQKRLFTQQSGNLQSGVNLLNPKSKNTNKRLSQMPNPLVNLNSLRQQKQMRQISFLSNGENNLNAFSKFLKKRVSEVSLHSLGNQKLNMKKHNRTRTQNIQEIQQTAQQIFNSTKNFVVDKNNQKIYKMKGQRLQTEFLESTFSPKKKYNLTNITDLQKIQTKCEQQETSHSINFDLIKNIQKIIKNIAQRSSQIIKKQYLLKQFLTSFYQQQYGGTGNMKICLQIIQQIKNRKYSNTPVVSCFNLLMNQTCSEIYRKDIFKLFAVLIDKNGGSLNNSPGGHAHYKNILSQILQIFINQKQVKIIMNGLCIQALNGCLADYFIAGQMQIRKRSIKTQLYRFLSQQILSPSQTLVSFQLIKQLTFFLSVNNIKLKNKLTQVRVYSEPNIQLHRLCLIAQKTGFKQLSQIQYTIEKKYQQFMQMSGILFDQQKVINLLAKQNLLGFPYMKQILHKQIQNFYKYNIPISRSLLKLCHLTVFEVKMQNELPLSDNLKLINEKSQKVDRLRFYQEILKKNNSQTIS